MNKPLHTPKQFDLIRSLTLTHTEYAARVDAKLNRILRNQTPIQDCDGNTYSQVFGQGFDFFFEMAK